LLYFAYGSNLGWAQMRKRCPSAKFVCVAKLPDHRLAFTRHSGNRGCGVADAVPDSSHEVWGVVYEISDMEVGALDRTEGFSPGRAKNAYMREERHVLVDGEDAKPMAVRLYFAQREANPPLPTAEYKRLIVEGAKFWRLPAGYVGELEEIETSR
jgi:gamma-glutamylcyclotransferase (GGCT)/AIG2-like uncharacterized protein YtfP